ncbi:CocE/NonD family Hydrolase [Colletotrichum musicola]|uniref:CocE/NonD family Hydrolase n=1 Tax=Colletotrichum musicola TaxID=2175873 RepID=A0A8H6K4K8_9PEZI|nr:CocE/NonD family Hydrolase [Colletotrichum musicola]
MAQGAQTTGTLVKMTICLRRIPGWQDDKFLHEYTNVHANMTRQVAAAVPILRSYTQLLSAPSIEVTLPSGGHEPWDAVSILGWTSLDALHASFQHPEYKASAGKHKFADEATQVGTLCQEVAEATFDKSGFEGRGSGAAVMVVMVPGSGSGTAMTDEELVARAAVVEKLRTGTGLLRYVANQSVTPADAGAFFEGTPFATTDWVTTQFMEQYWFRSRDAALEFLRGESRLGQLFSSLPPSLDAKGAFAVLGDETVVVDKARGI